MGRPRPKKSSSNSIPALEVSSVGRVSRRAAFWVFSDSASRREARPTNGFALIVERPLRIDLNSPMTITPVVTTTSSSTRTMDSRGKLVDSGAAAWLQSGDPRLKVGLRCAMAQQAANWLPGRLHRLRQQVSRGLDFQRSLPRPCFARPTFELRKYPGLIRCRAASSAEVSEE